MLLARGLAVLGFCLVAVSPHLIWSRGLDDSWTLFDRYPYWVADQVDAGSSIDGWIALGLALTGLASQALPWQRWFAVATGFVSVAVFVFTALEYRHLSETRHDAIGTGLFVALSGALLAGFAGALAARGGLRPRSRSDAGPAGSTATGH